MKLGAQTNSDMLNLMAMLICPGLDWKYSFWVDLVQQDKIV